MTEGCEYFAHCQARQPDCTLGQITYCIHHAPIRDKLFSFHDYEPSALLQLDLLHKRIRRIEPMPEEVRLQIEVQR